MALSNGAQASTRKLLAECGLDAMVAEIVSVDEVKLAKPRGKAYRHAAAKAGVEPGELALVAVHPWDIHGAAAARLITAYLAAERPYPSSMRAPDITGNTLPDLARSFAAL